MGKTPPPARSDFALRASQGQSRLFAHIYSLLYELYMWSTVRKCGTCDKRKRADALLKTTLPVFPLARFRHRRFNEKWDGSSRKRLCPSPYGPFRHRTYSEKDGYLPQNDFGSRFSAIACQLFLVPMAHFGIESIAKKDGYPSQNDFTCVFYGLF